MDLNFEERRYLILYLELFKCSYNPNDERKYDIQIHSILVRHIEMQNIAYLLEILKISFKYGFNWNLEYPYSPGFQTFLNNLDKKSKKITEFYDNFNQEKKKGKFNYYNEQLQDLISKYLCNKDISEIRQVSLVLEDILKEKHGSKFLVDIIYIGKTVMPGADLSTILKELNERNVYPSSEISETIWESLIILGIIELKQFTRKRTLEKESCQYLK